MPMPDQNAVIILKDQIFTVVGPPEKLHSDQDQNFEGHILLKLYRVFKVLKSRTTPYHRMGDSLAERMISTLLSLLCIYTQNEEDWEDHLQLLLCIYCTTRHSVTGLSP